VDIQQAILCLKDG